MLTRKGSKICFLRPLVLLERSFPYAVLFLGSTGVIHVKMTDLFPVSLGTVHMLLIFSSLLYQ